jgi:histidine ammonia-lyase
MDNHYIISNRWVTLDEFENLVQSGQPVRLSEKVAHGVRQNRSFLDEQLLEAGQSYYGINTGFGSLCNTIIPQNQLEQLQRNLVLSHACGTGAVIPNTIVKRMLLLKVFALSYGYSGIRLETLERLIFFYNKGIYPVVYEQGSLGASGDLAPLAHLSLPLIGQGYVDFEGKRWAGKEILTHFQLEPLVLGAKEGLALLNGTQFMAAYGTFAVANGLEMCQNWNKVAALSLEAYDGRVEPFDEKVNAIRRQTGQMSIAGDFRKLLASSEMIQQPKEHVQDPYSFRCIPQVHGASLDAIHYCAQVMEKEMNAVTDNPTLFEQENQVISAGNFHGQPLALAMDFLSIAVSELASISERRVYKLISGTRGLPPFLVNAPGLNSGFMIAQYTAASIVSQNKQLCTPASIDTIDSSNGQEDHVSMGANAATKLFRIIDNAYTVQGIELFTATQAIDFRKDKKSSPPLEELREAFRKSVPFLEKDELMAPLIQESIVFSKNKLKEVCLI